MTHSCIFAAGCVSVSVSGTQFPVRLGQISWPPSCVWVGCGHPHKDSRLHLFTRMLVSHACIACSYRMLVKLTFQVVFQRPLESLRCNGEGPATEVHEFWVEESTPHSN